MRHYAAVYLRLAVAAGFLSAVSDRFGLWGPPGTTNVAWGGFKLFTVYTGHLNPWAPAALVQPLAWFVTAAETALGFALILGLGTRYVALASGGAPESVRVGHDGGHGSEVRTQLLGVRRLSRRIRSRDGADSYRWSLDALLALCKHP